MHNPPAVQLVPDAEVGKGYGANDLHARRSIQVQSAYAALDPGLKRQLIDAHKAALVAQLALQELLVPVKRQTGDMLHDVVKLAEQAAANELATAQLQAASPPAPAVEKAHAQANDEHKRTLAAQLEAKRQQQEAQAADAAKAGWDHQGQDPPRPAAKRGRK